MQNATPTEAQITQARADVTTEIARTDAKAGTLMAALGLPIALI